MIGIDNLFIFSDGHKYYFNTNNHWFYYIFISQFKTLMDIKFLTNITQWIIEFKLLHLEDLGIILDKQNITNNNSLIL